MRCVRLFKDEKAVAAIEFAFIAPVLFFLIFATIEIGMVMVASSILESAVRIASRAGITGYTPVGMTRDQYVLQVIDQNLIFLKPANVTFTTEIYNTFSDIGQPEPYVDANHNGHYDLGESFTDINGNGQWDADMGLAGSGGPGAIVVYKVTYPWQIVTPFLAKFFSPTGVFNITASMVVMNEPYNSTGTSGGGG